VGTLFRRWSLLIAVTAWQVMAAEWRACRAQSSRVGRHCPATRSLVAPHHCCSRTAERRRGA